jgi:hypothetical protein
MGLKIMVSSELQNAVQDVPPDQLRKKQDDSSVDNSIIQLYRTRALVYMRFSLPYLPMIRLFDWAEKHTILVSAYGQSTSCEVAATAMHLQNLWLD